MRQEEYEDWLLSVARGAANGEEYAAMSGHVDADLKSFVHQFIRRKVRSGEWGQDTKRSRSAVLIAFYESTTVTDITRVRERHVVEFVGRKRSDGIAVSHGTRRNRLSTLRTFLDWAVRQGAITRNPADDISIGRAPKRLPRYLSEQEVAALVGACRDARDLAMLVLPLQTGMRRIELARLEIPDLDWATNTIDIRGKGDDDRRRPLPAEAGELLRRYLAQYPAPDGPVFRSYKTGRGLTPGGISRVMGRVFEDSGIKEHRWDGKSLHACRHTMISDVLVAHGPWAAKEAGGHRSWQAFGIYTRGMVSDELREAMEGRRYAS